MASNLFTNEVILPSQSTNYDSNEVILSQLSINYKTVYEEKSKNLNSWQKNALITVLVKCHQLFELKEESSPTFIIGPPGSGKSYIINIIVETIKIIRAETKIDITATTNPAASRISEKAITLSKWLKCGSDSMKLDKYEHILPIMMRNDPQSIKESEILIIDECSMLSAQQWSNLNQICRKIRNNGSEFGGILVIAVGDPFQLPPVPHDSGPGILRNKKTFIESILEQEISGYTYIVADQLMRADNKEFAALILAIVDLDKNVRRKALRYLNQHRYKHMNYENTIKKQQETGHVILCPVREYEESVAAYNGIALEISQENPLKKIYSIIPCEELFSEDDPEIIRYCRTQNDLDTEVKTIQSRDCWPEDNFIHTHLPYMIRSSFVTQEGYKVNNGDLGEILLYDEEKKEVKFRLYHNKKTVTIPYIVFGSEWINVIKFKALPLFPASAITVHKAQGATLNGIIINFQRQPNTEYSAHQIYTGISRVKRIEDITLVYPIVEDSLDSLEIQTKLERIWKMKFMKKYPTAAKISAEF